MFKSYDEGVLKRLQKAELSILMDFDRVCEAYGIRYFLVGGTLIGAVRHKGFIPWDDDLDVGMTRADYKKFVKIMEKELGKEYILATPVRYPGYCGGVIKVMRKIQNLYLDFGQNRSAGLELILIFLFGITCPIQG